MNARRTALPVRTGGGQASAALPVECYLFDSRMPLILNGPGDYLREDDRGAGRVLQTIRASSAACTGSRSTSAQ